MGTATRKTAKKITKESINMIRSQDLQYDLMRSNLYSLLIAVVSSLIIILTIVLLLLGTFEILPSFLGEFSKVIAVALAAVLLGAIMGFYRWFRDRKLTKFLNEQRMRSKKLF
jgi:hypothetical protein